MYSESIIHVWTQSCSWFCHQNSVDLRCYLVQCSFKMFPALLDGCHCQSIAQGMDNHEGEERWNKKQVPEQSHQMSPAQPNTTDFSLASGSIFSDKSSVQVPQLHVDRSQEAFPCIGFIKFGHLWKCQIGKEIPIFMRQSHISVHIDFYHLLPLALQGLMSLPKCAVS